MSSDAIANDILNFFFFFFFKYFYCTCYLRASGFPFFYLNICNHPSIEVHWVTITSTIQADDSHEMSGLIFFWKKKKIKMLSAVAMIGVLTLVLLNKLRCHTHF